MRFLLLSAALVFVPACSKPAPPTLIPQRASVTHVSPEGIGFELALLANNPNSVDIPASNVSAHVTLNDNIDVGTVTVEQKVTLVAKQSTQLTVDAEMPWSSLVPLAGLAMTDQRWVPYRIDGTLDLGGDLLSVKVPFTLKGNVSRDQVVKATLNSMPSIPGFTPPASDPSAPPSVRPGPRGPHVQRPR
jgi:LEA14-like dessication related protein